MLGGLTADESRLVVRGLWRADGKWAQQTKGIFTSGVAHRDQLVQLLLHCGYSPVAHLCHAAGAVRGHISNRKGDTRVYTMAEVEALSAAERATYKPIRCTVDNWIVYWAEPTSVSGKQSCWPTLSRRDAVSTEPYVAARDGRTWCVTVNHDEHLIVAQRAERHDGVVTKQSRPLVVGQSWASVAELVSCAGTEALVKTSEDGRILQVLKQDALTGGYLLTANYRRGKPLARGDFFQCCMMVPSWSLEWVRLRVVAYAQGPLRLAVPDRADLAEVPDEAFTGHCLLSLLFPVSFWYERAEQKLSIRAGLIHSGTFNKQVLSEQRGSMLHTFETLYGARPLIEWISAYQRLAVLRLQLCGFSIGLKDTMLSADSERGSELARSIQQLTRTSWLDAREAWVANDRYSELRISTALNNMKALGEKVTKQSLQQSEAVGAHSDASPRNPSAGNGIIIGIASGAKGSYPNVASMTVMVGQQNLEGKRMPLTFGGELGPRALPCYLGEQTYRERVEDGDDVFDQVTASRGHVKRNYRQGLTPSEFFFCGMGGREGMIGEPSKAHLLAALRAASVSLRCLTLFFALLRSSSLLRRHGHQDRKGLRKRPLVRARALSRACLRRLPRCALCVRVQTGYLQRRLVKKHEDLYVGYNGCVVNARREVVSFNHLDNWNPAFIQQVPIEGAHGVAVRSCADLAQLLQQRVQQAAAGEDVKRSSAGVFARFRQGMTC